jgi:hypothetical protein
MPLRSGIELLTGGRLGCDRRTDRGGLRRLVAAVPGPGYPSWPNGHAGLAVEPRREGYPRLCEVRARSVPTAHLRPSVPPTIFPRRSEVDPDFGTKA